MPAGYKAAFLLLRNPVGFYVLMLGVLLGVAILDAVTGNDLSFFVFYFFPISGVAWFRGRRAGIAVALLATVLWAIAYRYNAPFDLSSFVVWWNLGVPLGAFLCIAFSMSRKSPPEAPLSEVLPHAIQQRILLVDTGAGESSALRYAFTRAGLSHELHYVETCEKAAQWLTGVSGYEDRKKTPLPDIVILDLTDSAEKTFAFMEWVQHRKELAMLPLLTISPSEETKKVQRAYELNAASCFVKTSDYGELVDFLKVAQ